MNRCHVLIANAPRSYREAITGAIRHMRPGLLVSEGEPNQLEALIGGLSPDVVICSRLLPPEPSTVDLWIALYPDEMAQAIVRSGDLIWSIPDVELGTIIAILDRYVELAPMSHFDLPHLS